MKTLTVLTVSMLVMAAHPAIADCTPADNARVNSIGARQKVVAARLRAGDCSAWPEWRRLWAASHAILSDSARRPTCWVKWKKEERFPKCNGTVSTAKAAPADKPQVAAQPSSAPATKSGETASNANPRSSSCSDITGTSSTAPAATHCKDADRAVYAARQIRESNPRVAADEYKKAAAAARRAGDTNLELSILREAVEPVVSAIAPSTPAPPAVSSVAPSTPAAPTVSTVPPRTPAPVISAITPSVSAAPSVSSPASPTVSGIPRMWDGTKDRCDDANDLERATAGWYVMCVQPVLPKKQDTGYRPNPDPLELQKQARQACGSYSRDTQQCFADFKLKAILAQNPGMREACEKKAAEQGALRRQLIERLGSGPRNNQGKFLECVDNAYLYGDLDGSPDKPEQSLRDRIKKELAAKYETKPSDANRPSGPVQDAGLCTGPGRCCPPGQGMKETPGAFGARSCQPLGLFALNTQRRLDPNEEAELVEDYEEKVNNAVANAVAVAAAAEAIGSAMSETDRDVCVAASFAAVRSVLKGGAPGVPEQCRAMADAARRYFAHFARASADNSNSAMEDLLAGFRSDLGAPLPGLIGLTPDEKMQRAGECMLRGGTAETCN